MFLKPLPSGEDRFSTEGNAALEEMTRGVPLLAQVMHIGLLGVCMTGPEENHPLIFFFCFPDILFLSFICFSSLTCIFWLCEPLRVQNLD